MKTSILSQELEPLNAQIEQARERLSQLEVKLRAAEEELDTFSTDRQRFDALRDVCNALDRLEELGAGGLFWEGAPGGAEVAGHRDRLRESILGFEGEIREGLEKQALLKGEIDGVLDELDDLHEEVCQAHAREERRLDEFALEREMSPLPFRMAVMPWSGDREAESRFRRVLLVALALSIVFGSLIPLVGIPVPDRAEVVVEIPERLAMLVKKEPPRPAPAPVPEKVAEAEPPPEEKKPEPEKKKPEQTAKKEKSPEKVEPAPAVASKQAAKKKAENTGVLAFKNSFSELIDETPVAKLGTEARLIKDASQTSGLARPQRSLVAMQATGGSSGGIGNARVSRNLGSGGNGGDGNAGRIGGVGISQVESSLAGIAEEGRPLSDGSGMDLGRTDEEIQIVFDRYKATLYRIYNKELRRDPTLQGKLLLRITIEPGGEVSGCIVESTDLGSQELVAKIVERVERFNFGPKDGVPKLTILYPIDFLPAG